MCAVCVKNISWKGLTVLERRHFRTRWSKCILHSGFIAYGKMPNGFRPKANTVIFIYSDVSRREVGKSGPSQIYWTLSGNVWVNASKITNSFPFPNTLHKRSNNNYNNIRCGFNRGNDYGIETEPQIYKWMFIGFKTLLSVRGGRLPKPESLTHHTERE